MLFPLLCTEYISFKSPDCKELNVIDEGKYIVKFDEPPLVLSD